MEDARPITRSHGLVNFFCSVFPGFLGFSKVFVGFSRVFGGFSGFFVGFSRVFVRVF